jgi:hypothetical protein
VLRCLFAVCVVCGVWCADTYDAVKAGDLKGALRAGMDTVRTGISAAQNIKDTIGQARGLAGDIHRALPQGARDKLREVGDRIANSDIVRRGKDMVDRGSRIARDVMDRAKPVIEQGKRAVESVRRVYEGGRRAFDRIRETIGSGRDAFDRAMRGDLRGAIESARNAINSGREAIQGVRDTMREARTAMREVRDTARAGYDALVSCWLACPPPRSPAVRLCD